jgi:hypothetical protein
MIKRPGERRIERAAALEGRWRVGGAVCTKLQIISILPKPRKEISQIQRVNQHKLRQNHCRPLEIHRLPTVIFQIIDP